MNNYLARIDKITHNIAKTKLKNLLQLWIPDTQKHNLQFILYEKFRIIILTRCRLSCFDINIEHGRYLNTPRNKRLCTNCFRMKYKYIIMHYPSVREILNPKLVYARKVAKYLIKLCSSLVFSISI